jgi:2-dehydropantoate 2-reductase
MRVAIMGSGGIGGPLGASLAQAGNEVTFIARGAHLDAIQQNGFRVEGERGTTHIHPANATANPAGIGIVDLVLFCVKLWDIEAAGEAIRPIVGPDTTVIPLQNGIDAPERLAAILGPRAVMGGVAMVSGNIVAPGVIRQTSPFQRVIFGERGGGPSPRGEAIRKHCMAAGFEGDLVADIALATWEKFNFIVPFNGLSALTRLPLGPLRDDPDIWALFETLLRETTAVGQARGLRLPPDIAETQLAWMQTAPPHHYASTALDLIRGNRLEVPWLTGKLVALGREYGVPTPANTFVYAALKPYINGPRIACPPLIR